MFAALALFAQTKDAGLPPEKAVLMLLFFGAVGAVSTVGLFSSRTTLESLAGVIGTKNPLVARVVCGVGVVVGVVAVLVSTLSLLGKL